MGQRPALGEREYPRRETSAFSSVVWPDVSRKKEGKRQSSANLYSGVIEYENSPDEKDKVAIQNHHSMNRGEKVWICVR